MSKQYIRNSIYSMILKGYKLQHIFYVLRDRAPFIVLLLSVVLF